ncbi:MAG: hypothetical protein ABIS50_06590 [Luteolibacter sp.]|uniref:hypothetical protein n=1 Tax=Luteolibacter sp. TaxID=1962973 RepID=UPI003266DA5D
MKQLSFLLLVSCFWTLPANAQTNGIDQPFSFIAPPTGGKFVVWYGKTGRSYFIQVSDPADPLKKWNWAPAIESGNNEEISYEVDGTADKAFYRLQYTDQTATNLDTADFDNDGLTNLAEITPYGWNSTQTNPLDPDTDHDGLTDKFERDHGLDPTDNGSLYPGNGFNGDADGDGISNGDEQAKGTNPSNPDSDGDGANDDDEIKSGHDPLSNESYPPVWRKAQRSIRRDLGLVWTEAFWDSSLGTSIFEAVGPEDYADFLSEDISFPTAPPSQAPFGVQQILNGGYSDNTIGAELIQTRFWLETKPAVSGDRKIKVLQMTKRGPEFTFDTAGTTSFESVEITIQAGHTVSDPVDILPAFTGDHEKVQVTLIPVAVADNVTATGVDDMSLTADPTDTGYQDKFWIMAPSGNDPNGSPCSNEMKFKIPFNSPLGMEISYPSGGSVPATPTPGTVTLGVDPPTCGWHGSSATTTETPAPVWKIGSPGETKIAATLPIGVKTMKRRTVKVAVWPINRPGRAAFFTDAAAKDAYEAKIQNTLDQIFAYQINAWSDVDVQDERPFEHANTGSAFTIKHGPQEKAMINTYRTNTADINVYVIKDSFYRTGDPAIPTTYNIAGSSYPVDDTTSGTYANCAVVTLNSDDPLHNMAHEIGHLIVGPGHPDLYDPLMPLAGGVAPLQHLTETAHLKRIMFSEENVIRGSQLVKSEWDKAETWLSERTNGDN